MLAVNVLAVTRDVDQLLAILFEPVDESVHRAAIDGLQSIASGSASGHDVIEKSLSTRLPMSEAQFVMQLIVGLSPAQAEDHAISTALVQLLSDERLAIRTIAIYRIEEISGDRHNYYPAAEPVRRRDAIRRLQKSIERHGGTLVP
jgi:HEAT repeat protein